MAFNKKNKTHDTQIGNQRVVAHRYNPNAHPYNPNHLTLLTVDEVKRQLAERLEPIFPPTDERDTEPLEPCEALCDLCYGRGTVNRIVPHGWTWRQVPETCPLCGGMDKSEADTTPVKVDMAFAGRLLWVVRNLLRWW